MYLHLFVIYKVFVHFLGTISCWSSWPLWRWLGHWSWLDLSLRFRLPLCFWLPINCFVRVPWLCLVLCCIGLLRLNPFLWLLHAKIFSVSCQFTAHFCFHFIRAFSNFSSIVPSVHLSPCIGCIRTLAPCLLLYIHLFWRCFWLFWSPEHWKKSKS